MVFFWPCLGAAQSSLCTRLNNSYCVPNTLFEQTSQFFQFVPTNPPLCIVDTAYYSSRPWYNLKQPLCLLMNLWYTLWPCAQMLGCLQSFLSSFNFPIFIHPPSAWRSLDVVFQIVWLSWSFAYIHLPLGIKVIHRSIDDSVVVDYLPLCNGVWRWFPFRVEIESKFIFA